MDFQISKVLGTKMYSCYKIIDNKAKQIILKSFPSLAGYTVICDHITHDFGSDVVPPELTSVEVVGIVNDPGVVVGLLLKVNGSEVRPDGKKYHITIGVGPKVKPVHTNVAIDNGHYTLLSRPTPFNPEWFAGVVQE